MTKYVSLANLTILLPVVSGWRSAAVTMYDAGPRPEPYITLAVMSATDEHWPAYRVQWLDHWRNPWSSYVYCQVAQMLPSSSSVSRVWPCRTPLRNRTRRRARTDRQSSTQSMAGALLGKCIGVQYTGTSQEIVTEVEWLRSLYSMSSVILSQWRQCRSGIERFGSFNNTVCKRVLSLLEAGHLRLKEVVVKRITMIKCGVQRWRWQWYRLLWNWGKGGFSGVDECCNSKI